MAKQKRPESAEARRFAVILSGLLTLLAALSWWRHHPTRATVLVSVAAGALFLAFLLRPVWVRFFRLWMKFALVLSWVMTRVLLTIIYYVLVTPYGLLSRVFRKDPLDLDWKNRRPSYWVDKVENEAGLREYERQF